MRFCSSSGADRPPLPAATHQPERQANQQGAQGEEGPGAKHQLAGQGQQTGHGAPGLLTRPTHHGTVVGGLEQGITGGQQQYGQQIAERAELAAAEAAALEAEQQWRRQRALAATGAISRGQLDTARSQRDQTQAQVRAAREQLGQLETGYRPEEIAQSDAQLQGAKAALASAELALADAVLTAPSDGILLTRAIETGSMVQPGATAFNLSLTAPVWVRAYVEEPWLGHFPSGARVTLTTDSRPDKPYQGVVGFVSPTAEFTPKSVETPDLRTHLVYRLRIVVQDPDSALRQGMPVTVRLAP
ncbi:efflux RND transporter periplasmic adaptor subunit [Aeromonas hydrophila]|uniref:efflux RND transporter periplasmic adaptor subunit n=1 Tax=Aeromonas hydrophila TaxID=644 RepID=UPI001CF055ED|nr:efflux RND transporter periplasmic adaptor subunit [Aeromonas hydrophila]UCM57776.1 efflux RND transporter periplasmic adaptor subunit [Aeromonas hydrophila]